MVTPNDDFRQGFEDDDGNLPDPWKPNPGEKLFGTLERYDSGITQYGTSPIAIIRDEESSELVAVWLFHTVLLSKFDKLKPQPGERIALKRLPNDPAKRYKKFALRVDRAESAQPIPNFAAYIDSAGDVTPEDRAQVVAEAATEETNAVAKPAVDLSPVASGESFESFPEALNKDGDDLPF